MLSPYLRYITNISILPRCWLSLSFRLGSVASDLLRLTFSAFAARLLSQIRASCISNVSQLPQGQLCVLFCFLTYRASSSLPTLYSPPVLFRNLRLRCRGKHQRRFLFPPQTQKKNAHFLSTVWRSCPPLICIVYAATEALRSVKTY